MKNERRYISHRGNLFGIEPEKENTIRYIKKAIDAGYDVEIDIWFFNGSLYLGHDFDSMKEKVSLSFLKENVNRVWCHAKNIPAFIFLKENNIHTFYQTIENFVLTTEGFLWLHSGFDYDHEKSVHVFLDRPKNISFGNFPKNICSDHIVDWEKIGGLIEN